MSGLRFESMADMPPRMRELYARQQLPGAAAAPKKASKYHSTPAERGELRFDSQKEARRYDELMVMLRAGIISDLRLSRSSPCRRAISPKPVSASAQCGTRRTFRTNLAASSSSKM